MAVFIALSVLLGGAFAAPSGSLPAPGPQIQARHFPGAFQARLDSISRSLIGRGYRGGPLGEGDSALGDAKPRFRLDSFDCVTYLETSLALAFAPDTGRLLPGLDSIRYLDGKVGWRWRNHFFEGEWLPRNARFARLVRFPDDTSVTRILARRSFYAKRGFQVPDTAVQLHALWRDRALVRFSRPSDSTRIRGVALVGKSEGFPVAHTGFLVERSGRVPLLRHASQAGTVREQPFADYLRGKPQFAGVLVWEILEPPKEH